MEILGQRPVWSMSGSDMLSTLDATYAEIARLETLALHLIAGLDTTGHAHELGAGTTARLLTFRYRIDPTKARRDVHLATTLPKYPAVAAALPDPNPLTDNPTTDTGASDSDLTDDDASDSDTSDRNGSDGEHGAAADGAGVDGAGGTCAGVGVLLHPAQAEAIVAALDKIPTTVAADDLQVAEQQLVELGRTHGPLDLRKAGRLIRDRLDTDGPEPTEQKAYDRETLTLKNAANGVAFTGYLANDNAELFRTLIHTHAKPHKTIDGAPDPRPRTKRQADALTTLLTTTNPTTGTATTTTAATTRATAPADTATAAPASASTSASAPTDTAATTDTARIPDAMQPHLPTDPRSPSTTSDIGAGRDRPLGFIPGHGPKPHITVTIDYNDLKAATADKLGHLIYGDALSAATIRRLACDAHILPIVLGSDSQPLDVGTTVRLATGPIRKALIARDKGCVCCGAPPIYCDAHHVKSWIDGGATKITNLVLLCKRCHRDLHAGHWTIQITNGIVEVARPAWATPNPVPRDRYRPPTTTPNTTKPTPRSSTRGAADATTPGVTTPGAPARAWPRDTDPPWITPDDTARLNPWGDTPDHRAPDTHDQQKHQNHQGPTSEPGPPRPPTSTFDPWGEDSDSRPHDPRCQSTEARIAQTSGAMR
ncbi:HNH endonuclease [Kribbella sp. NBC_01510]|uniref:HNH endonuclease signature motif containing protein n=1 Tax=Kribbella sp. NBC_01510 TaxID=2903581 RepID=UPI00386DA756